MKNLKLLNKKYLSIIFFFSFFGLELQSQEPIDIWNVEEKQKTEEIIIKENLDEKKRTTKILFMKCSLKKEMNQI